MSQMPDKIGWKLHDGYLELRGIHVKLADIDAVEAVGLGDTKAEPWELYGNAYLAYLLVKILYHIFLNTSMGATMALVQITAALMFIAWYLYSILRRYREGAITAKLHNGDSVLLLSIRNRAKRRAIVHAIQSEIDTFKRKGQGDRNTSTPTKDTISAGCEVLAKPAALPPPLPKRNLST